MNDRYEHIRHEFEPVYDEYSEILILGSLPSVKSRENRFYYGHPQNRFWKVLAAVSGSSFVPSSVEDRKQFLISSHIAVWDVIEECDIIGSSDSSIKNVVPADVSRILRGAPIRRIYANGGTSYNLYMKYIYPETKREIIKLPSTSPANAAFGLDRLIEIWGRNIHNAQYPCD